MSQTEINGGPAFSLDYLKLFIQFIEEKGIDSRKILKDCGIKSTSLITQSGYISSEQFFQFVRNLASLVNLEEWGLAFGSRLHASTHGLLGNMSISAQNSLQSLMAYRKYLEIRGTVVSFDYQITEKSIILSYGSLLESASSYRFAIDASMSATYTLIKSKLGCSPKVLSIHLTYNQPKDSDKYLDFYGTQPKFAMQNNAIEFSLDNFLKDNFSANAQLFNQAQRQSDAALNEIRKNIDLPDVILNRLLLANEQFPMLDEMADILQINSRTLRRQLKKLNTSYQTIVSQAKEKLAARYLADTNTSIEEIASLLGYSEAANFTRAFKRWTGYSPKDFRDKKLYLE